MGQTQPNPIVHSALLAALAGCDGKELGQVTADLSPEERRAFAHAYTLARATQLGGLAADASRAMLDRLRAKRRS